MSKTTKTGTQTIPPKPPVREMAGEQLLVKKDPPEEVKGSILMPDASKERPLRGVVVKAGPGKYKPGTDQRLPMPVKEGDVIVFPRYCGVETEIDGETYGVIPASDVLAVLEEVPA